MRQAERGKQRWGASWPDGKADGGRRSAGRQPVTLHQYCPVQLVPQHPELTFNPGEAPETLCVMPGSLIRKQ